ncbi:MAG: T9SS type A sorting domain-containing protein [Bacteroidetes Order II. Incertae sedis bacterium]|nr:T9SS type A sorting domain-containing protein [Bacteroidetes Order II. bacterium]
MLKIISSLFIFASTFFAFVFAQSPPDLIDDITWSAGTSTVTDISNAFNAGRRGEETQLGLTSNILGNLTMPSQSVWDAMSFNEKGFFLVNAERTARANVNYGGMAVKGLPLEGINDELTNTAQSYADYLISVNQFAHNATPAHPLGLDPFTRVENTIPANCREFIAYSENLAAFWSSGSSNPMPIERAIFGWIYEDKGSAWGHRRLVLIQDYQLGGSAGDTTGFDNNYGTSSSEGFLGFAVANHAAYNPFGFSGMNMGTVIVMLIFDPQPTCSVPLPVTLTSFTSVFENQRVALKWETTSEPNFDGFWVEIAELTQQGGGPEMGMFRSMAFLPAKGTPETGATYNYQPGELALGTYFFRLKKVDKNGLASYTSTQRIEVSNLPEGYQIGGVYPNPFGEHLTVEVTVAKQQRIDFQVLDLQGRQLLSAGSQEVSPLVRYRKSMNLNGLAQGTYFLRIHGETFTKTLSITHVRKTK